MTRGALAGSAALLWLAAAGCSMQRSAEPALVSDAWQEAQADPPGEVVLPFAPPAPGHPIATVDGEPIDHDQFLHLLVAGRGSDLLEQLIVLELARRRAQAAGLTVTGSEVQADYDDALRSLLNQLPAADETALDQDAGQRLLDRVLTGRGISHEEYRLSLLRNAYLRKLARARMQVSEQELREEFARAYGDRVRVRHLQLAPTADMDRVQRALQAGADFADVAREYSANTITAPSGGLLQPFARGDPEVPALLREAAFRLDTGQVSNPIRVNNWYHIIRLEEQLPASDVTFDEVRGELRERLLARRLPVEMERISAELFEQARVEIFDPAMKAEFFKRHPELRRSPRQ